MRIECKTDGKPAIDITIILDPDDDMFIKETIIPIKLTVKRLPIDDT